MGARAKNGNSVLEKLGWAFIKNSCLLETIRLQETGFSLLPGSISKAGGRREILGGSNFWACAAMWQNSGEIALFFCAGFEGRRDCFFWPLLNLKVGEGVFLFLVRE